MKVYRALNEQDEQDYLDGKGFSCICDDNLERYFNEKFNSNNTFNNIKNSLDYVFDHLKGTALKNNMSPWISTSKNIADVIRQYSIPKNTAFNTEDRRRPIAIIDIDNVHEDKDELARYLYDLYVASKTTDGKKVDGFAIDLSDDRLKEFYNTQFIKLEDFNSSNINIIDDKIINPNLNPSANKIEVKKMIDLPEGVKHAQNYKEVLVYSKIPKDNIKLILTPLMLDILYGSSKTIDDLVNHMDLIKKEVKDFYQGLSFEEQHLFEYLYFPDGNIDNALDYNKNTAFINLTDLLTGKKFKLYEEYQFLKLVKRGIIEKFNNRYGVHQSYAKLTDDCSYVGIVDEEYDMALCCKADSLLYIQQGDRVIRANSIYGMNKLKDMRVRTK